MKRRLSPKRAITTTLGIEPLEARLVLDAANSIPFPIDPLPSQVGVSTFANTPTATMPAVNLIQNGGFETGLSPWSSTFETNLSRTSTQSKSGAYAARVTNRTQDWHGARQSLQGSFTNGEQIAISVWVKVENAAQADFDILIRQADSNGVSFTYVVEDTATNSQWRQLTGTFNLKYSGNLTSLELWVVGPASGVSFLIDDVNVGRFDWRAAADARIDEFRKSDARIRLIDQFGNPLHGATVAVNQISHDFAFGSAINHNVIDNQDYANFAKQAFNWATIEYESTWSSNEFIRGVESYFVADQIIAWAEANNIPIRGHHLFWAQDAPAWADGLTNQQLLDEMEQRLVNALAHYEGKLEHWDALNESLNGSYYSDRLGDSIEPWIYQRARQIDPNVELFVNEYQILEGFLADDYVKHIQWMQSQGATIDGVGVQAHLPGVVEPFTILSRLDELSTLDLPIWITEFDVAHPNENLRADQVEQFYRVAFSHPQVQGIILWDFWAGSAGRDPDRTWMDVDGRINAAGQRYLALIDEWTTNIAATPAQSGTLDFRGFHGDYQVIVTLADGSQHIENLSLASGTQLSTYTFQYATYPSVALAASVADDAALNGTFTAQVSAKSYFNTTAGQNFTFEFDWNNDGVYEQSVAAGSAAAVNHVFSNPGATTFKVRARDARGAVSTPVQHTLAVTGFKLVPNAGNPALTNLVWSGTFGADTVVFTQLKPGVYQADVFRLDGQATGRSYGFEGVTGQLLTSGLGGGDQITTKNFSVAPAVHIDSRDDAQDAIANPSQAETAIDLAFDASVYTQPSRMVNSTLGQEPQSHPEHLETKTLRAKRPMWDGEDLDNSRLQNRRAGLELQQQNNDQFVHSQEDEPNPQSDRSAWIDFALSDDPDAIPLRSN